MASNGKTGRRSITAEHDVETGGKPVQRKTSKQKRADWIQARSRTHSDGSTLGAFYQHNAPENQVPKEQQNEGPRRRRSSTRKPKESTAKAPKNASRPPLSYQLPQTSGGTGSDLGDVASMAIAGLGDDVDFGELLDGAPPLKSKQRRPRARSPPQSGVQLPTIMDDSEHHQGPTRFEGLGGLRQNNGRSEMRTSLTTLDSLRVSETSADMADDAAAMLTNLDRDNSMFLSEVSDIAATGHSRPSLFGSSIVDKQRTNRLPASKPPPVAARQQEEIANFSAMLHADYGAAATSEPSRPPKPEKEATRPLPSKHSLPYSADTSSDDVSFDKDEDMFEDEIDEQHSSFLAIMDPTSWLTKDVKFDDKGVPFFDERAGWTIAGFVRHLFFNPISPEFTSLQQFCWAVVLGIVMGFYTAFWKEIIEHSVEIMWKELPEALLEWGVFTELDGAFPLYHWMWICPAFWGGLLSYIFAALPTPIPGQNEWIEGVHTMGVQDSETFFLLFVLATLGMASGLSLGPELPLILTSGMIGSWLAIQCKQSVLQARVMNITCASAAIGGFFGFPMAGALFVMEVPHRMGLQYFEALSPATIASIVAVLCNRMVTGNDVTGYYSYPFLTTSLPSEIFTSAIIFGLFGAFVGTVYAKTVLKLKGGVHDFFHAPHDDHHCHGEKEAEDPTPNQEKTPLILKGKAMNGGTKAPQSSPTEVPIHQKIAKATQKYLCCVIPYEPHRAAAAGVVAGTMCGLIGLLLPHVMFWGEAQLQSMIDKGRTPLPVFGQEDEPTAALTAKAFCMVNPNDAASVRAGFSLGCSLAITLAKIVVTGLSLGTGIIGGHFWGPLFTGCAASHFLTDITRLLNAKIGFGGSLAAYPCVTILCTMGSTHVVTFRAHTAIMLILTLTISAFDPEDSANGTGSVAGDYSAVFPLLVVSVFVALMVSRQTVFYKTQRSRGDIMALPEVLCEPGKEGMPMVLDYEGNGTYDEYDDEYYDSDASGSGGGVSENDGVNRAQPSIENKKTLEEQLTQEMIEREFNAKVGAMAAPAPPQDSVPPKKEASVSPSTSGRGGRQNSSESERGPRGISPLPPRPKAPSGEIKPSKKTESGDTLGGLSSSRLDELLSKPLETTNVSKPRHRRIQSAPDVDFGKRFQRERSSRFGKDDKSIGEGSAGGGGRHTRSDSFGSQASGKVMRVTTVGHLTVQQPSLMDQARLRSATSVIVESRHVRNPSMPSRIGRRGHSRQNSASSIGGNSTGPPLQVAVAVENGTDGVTPSEVERAYSSAMNRQRAGNGRTADGSAR